MKFDNLDLYYDYLENDNSLLFDYNVSNSLVNLRDKIEDTE